MRYTYQQQGPGCGGCLVIGCLIALVSGGFSGLGNFLGFVFYTGLIFVLVALAVFFGFQFWLQRQVASYAATQSESHNRFVWLLVHILVKIAQLDDHVSRDEVQTIQRFFQYNLHYNQTKMAWVKNLIKEATESTETPESMLEEFKRTFAYEPRLILLELIYQIVYTKDPVPQNELEKARQIAIFLEISQYDLRTIEAKYTYHRQRQATEARVNDAQYYAVLGLEPGADMETIKKSYRQLSMKYHPDKVSHLGEEFQEVAEEKMKEINAAYDFFKKKFGA
ncbi:MAG: DnaJ domain-containing protein [Desulfofustis sp.]|nr:DnaJ domain-containing protein [Desulfofustis sp.]RZW16375.1 MAG: J domain-containing protein [Desulfobulbaceae bacterium]